MAAPNYIGQQVHRALFILILYVTLSACERKIGEEDLPNADSSWLVVNTVVDETENVDLATAVRASKGVGEIKQAIQTESVDLSQDIGSYIEGDGFDVITSVTNEWKGEDLEATTRPNQFASDGSVSRAATPMPVGVKYRLVLYKQVGTTQTFWRQKQLESSTTTAVDTTQQIEVVRGDTYQWYAYSYNNTDDIPPIANTSTDVQISTGINSDFLYASGTISISAAGIANTPLTIVFRHQVARLAVEIDARGMFADRITALGITVGGLIDGNSPLTSGMFGLLDGEMISSTSYTPNTSFTINNFQNVDAGFNDRKAIYFYSATPASFANVAVTLGNVTIAMDDGPTERVFSGLNRAFTFNATTGMTAGRTYNAKIDLIESPVTVAGVRWARTNLYLNSGTRNPYRFNATLAHTNKRSSYFPFRSNTPYMFGRNGDPCALVHPTTRPGDGLSVWRQPTGPEFSTLGTSGPLGATGPSQTVIHNVIDGRGYYEYAATGTAAPYPSSNLRFNMNGVGTAVNVVAGLITIDIGISNYGTEVRNWSSEQLLNVGGALGLGAYGYRATRVPQVLLVPAYNAITPNVLEVLSLSLVGADLLQSSFQNVRCVRR